MDDSCVHQMWHLRRQPRAQAKAQGMCNAEMRTARAYDSTMAGLKQETARAHACPIPGFPLDPEPVVRCNNQERAVACMGSSRCSSVAAFCTLQQAATLLQFLGPMHATGTLSIPPSVVQPHGTRSPVEWTNEWFQTDYQWYCNGQTYEFFAQSGLK